MRAQDDGYVAELPRSRGQGTVAVDVTDDMKVALRRVADEGLKPRSVAVFGGLAIRGDRLAHDGAPVETRRSPTPSGLHGKAVVRGRIDSNSHRGYVSWNA